MSAPELKARAAAAIEGAFDELVALSEEIHETPELAFEEVKASAAVARRMSDWGFSGGADVAGLPTAVRAQVGDGALTVAFCAEYDALPDIGHACGHNLIAAASVGAARGLAEVADALDLTCLLLGTPAEESGGGKIEMLKAGVFDGVHAALMAHPAPMAFDIPGVRTSAVVQWEITYTGRTSHAAIAPQLGINAADAATLAQVAIGLLRQHIPSDHLLHGIVRSAGAAPNVVPGDSSLEYYLRAPILDKLAELEPRVRACFLAGAQATGAQCAIAPVSDPYADMVSDAELVELFAANATELGRNVVAFKERGRGSTDMGNVSQLLPSIQPMFGLDVADAMLHQPEFTAAALTDSAHQAMRDMAVALAHTAIDAAAGRSRDRLMAGSRRP